jgi:hypothetical protein
MQVPSYRKHSSGQARVSINGRDYLLGTYGSKESQAKYNRLLGEWFASNQSKSFGVPVEQLITTEGRLTLMARLTAASLLEARR